MDCSKPGFPALHCLPEFAQTHVHWVGGGGGGGLVAKSCLTLSILWIVACQAPLVHGILHARILEWVDISFSRGSSQPKSWTRVSCIAGIFFTDSTMREDFWVSDAIQPPHPLLPPSPSAINLSQHRDLSQWVSSSNQTDRSIGASASASVLPMNIQCLFTLGLSSLFLFP